MIPLIGLISGLFCCFMISGTCYCVKPECCEDDEFVYMSSAERSDYEYF
jgi:hypothetical protein